MLVSLILLEIMPKTFNVLLFSVFTESHSVSISLKKLFTNWFFKLLLKLSVISLYTTLLFTKSLLTISSFRDLLFTKLLFTSLSISSLLQQYTHLTQIIEPSETWIVKAAIYWAISEHSSWTIMFTFLYWSAFCAYLKIIVLQDRVALLELSFFLVVCRPTDLCPHSQIFCASIYLWYMLDLSVYLRFCVSLLSAESIFVSNKASTFGAASFARTGFSRTSKFTMSLVSPIKLLSTVQLSYSQQFKPQANQENWFELTKVWLN